MSKPVKVEWKELPPASPSRVPGQDVLDAVKKLKERPGCWAIVQRDVPGAHAGARFKKRGCEVATRQNKDTTPPTIDLFARWPEADPQAVAGASAIAEIADKAPGRGQTSQEPAAPAAAAPEPAPETPPAAPSAEDIESALRLEGEKYGIQFPASFDFTNPVNAKAARERISFARGRARRANGI